MTIIMQFAFQIILLAIGFGVGYWLIITANTQEGTIKTLGQALGGVLIIMAMILEIFSGYYSMKVANGGYMEGGCPMNRTMSPINGNVEDIKDKGESDQNIQSINPREGEEQEASEESKNIPIKKSIEDHE